MEDRRPDEVDEAPQAPGQSPDVAVVGVKSEKDVKSEQSNKKEKDRPVGLENILAELPSKRQDEEELRKQLNFSVMKYYKPLVKRKKITLKMEEENYISLSEEDIRYQLDYPHLVTEDMGHRKVKMLEELNNGPRPSVTDRYQVSIAPTEKSIGKEAIDIGFVERMLTEAEDGDLIVLPEGSIRISSLSIGKNVHIKGSSGTIIEVIDGPIIIDNTTLRVTISEVTFIYENRRQGGGAHGNITISRDGGESKEVSTISRSGHREASTFMAGHYGCLFIVKAGGCLELRDCALNCKGGAGRLSAAQDIACYLKSKTEENGLPNLILKNCHFSNFARAVEGGSFNNLYVEKSIFSTCTSYSINLANPLIVLAKESRFEHSGKAALNVHLSRSVSGGAKRLLQIENCDFLNSTSYCLTVFNELAISLEASLLVYNNRFIRCGKDAIGLKHLDFASITITSNLIKGAKGSGILLHNVIDSSNENLAQVSENKISECETAAVTVVDSLASLESNEIFNNKGCGISVRSDPSSSSKRKVADLQCRLICNKNSIHNNEGDGVKLMGVLNGPIIFNSCSIYENTNGVVCNHEQTGPGRAPEGRSATGMPRFEALVLFEKSSIFQSKKHGIWIFRSVCKIYLSETSIYENKEAAVYLESREAGTSLVFKELKNNRINDFVKGFIGGQFGALDKASLEPPSTRRKKGCILF
eukprot:TRINITY_DN13472_c0_g1_i3.p1 TRINITY_DN13472_c0_g1~~TRINITY_DN13472_c0_g1_i3.p1  ORF type:complete len:701 (-),score=91.28 TRINITY_DN13472_c0_g1_i3:113-2215(-)